MDHADHTGEGEGHPQEGVAHMGVVEADELGVGLCEYKTRQGLCMDPEVCRG